MSSMSAQDVAPIPLRLDLEYVDASQDACFAWLQGKYADLRPAANASSDAAAAHGASANHNDDKSDDFTSEAKAKKPHVDKVVLQRIENDIGACDALRWRVFAFPSHPTQPLNSSYRNGPKKGDAPAALTAQLHKIKKAERKQLQEAAAETSSDADTVKPPRYALVISTQATADARKKDDKKSKQAKKQGRKTSADASTTVPPPVKVEALMEKLVREEALAQRCRLLGEDNVVFNSSPEVPRTATSSAPFASSLFPSSWVRRWTPQSWRPLFGGYVSAPNPRTDSARFLLFPQSAHPPVDFRDPTQLAQLPRGKALTDPQSVPYFLRGSVNWDIEKHNPAAATAAPATAAEASGSAPPPPSSGGLSYSVLAARTLPVTVRAGQAKHSWADAVEVSVAAQQSRTERQYAPEREKVQRVSLLEDTAVVKLTRGDPRYSLAVTATHATVPNSGVKHAHEALTDNSSPSPAEKKEKKKRRDTHDTQAALSACDDDAIDQLQVQDCYDSSVQNFALPGFWQRLVRPSLRTSKASDVAESGTGTQVLEDAPRGLYRVRWSGGPGIEACRAGIPGSPHAPPPSLFTIFGKLWTESWMEVPLPWRLALKLRTQSAVTVPLEPSQPVWPAMVSGTSTTSPAGEANTAVASGEGGTSEQSQTSCIREHPYFWATQGPRWDAALVRGFKNDYSGMHHARRWYSILSAELTLNGNTEKPGGKSASMTRPPKGSADRTDSTSTEDADGVLAPPPPAASRWRNTSLTAFANACMVDTVRDYPRASVGFSFTSKIPRMAISPFNEIIPRRFECSFSWFAAFTAGGNSSTGEGGGRGFNVSFLSGVQPPQQQTTRQGGEGASAVASPTAAAADGMPFLRVSPVETFHHMKCGLTWKFDE